MLLFGCQSSSKRTMLTPEIRYMSDTMFARYKAGNTPVLDSICEVKRPAYVKIYIDSLLSLERDNIEDLIR
jgi:hypothetical protein